MKEKINEFLDIDETSNISAKELNKSIDEEISALQTKPNKSKKNVKTKAKKRHKQVKKTKKQARTLGEGPVIRIFEPVNYKDAKDIAQALLNEQITYVYLTKLTSKEANRIIDFLTGLVYGLAGDIERLDQELFICTPKKVEITDQMRERI